MRADDTTKALVRKLAEYAKAVEQLEEQQQLMARVEDNLSTLEGRMKDNAAKFNIEITPKSPSVEFTKEELREMVGQVWSYNQHSLSLLKQKDNLMAAFETRNSLANDILGILRSLNVPVGSTYTGVK